MDPHPCRQLPSLNHEPVMLLRSAAYIFRASFCQICAILVYLLRVEYSVDQVCQPSPQLRLLPSCALLQPCLVPSPESLHLKALPQGCLHLLAQHTGLGILAEILLHGTAHSLILDSLMTASYLQLIAGLQASLTQEACLSTCLEDSSFRKSFPGQCNWQISAKSN